jgi:hypothetical protein
MIKQDSGYVGEADQPKATKGPRENSTQEIENRKIPSLTDLRILVGCLSISQEMMSF